MLDILYSSLKKEFKIRNIDLKVDLDFFKNKKTYEYRSKEKEYLLSIYEYYDFINNSSSLDFVERIYSLLLKDKSFFLDTLKDKYSSHVSNEEKVIFISIIILKAMTELSSIAVDYFGTIKNSDRVLDTAASYFNNYLVFYFYPIHSRREVRTIFFKFFEYLVFYKLIKQIKICNREGSVFKTIKMWSIEDIYYQSLGRSYNLLLYPAEIVTYNETSYLKGQHFSRVYLLCVENYKSGDSFYIKDSKYIERTINKKLYIDVENGKWIKTMIENEYKTSLDLLKKEVVTISNQIKLKFTNYEWNDEIKEEVSNLQKDYSKKMELIVLLTFLSLDMDEKDPIYFIPFYDFRGRKYIDSMVGPTTSKISRFLFHYGFYEETDFSDKLEIERIFFFKERIVRFCNHNGINYHDKYLSIIFWLLVGIGKQLIDKTNIYIEDHIFIEKGISLYENGNEETKLSFIDRLEIQHYVVCLKSLNDKVIKKRVIIKDATASVYQLLLTIMGPKDEKSLEYVNLGNCNRYVDTYSLQIELFIESLSSQELVKFKDHLFLLIRSVIKKTAMTIPYSAGFDICYNDFKKKVSDNGEIHSFNKECEEMYWKYYNFIKNGMERKYLYKTTTKGMYKEIMKEFEEKREYFKESDTGKASFRYFKTQNYAIDVNIKVLQDGNIIKKRISRLIRKTTTSIDINQTKKALGANIVHFADGDILRELENELNYSFATIHDCVLVDMNSVSKVIMALNRIYQRKIDALCGPGRYKVNCMFIIL